MRETSKALRRRWCEHEAGLIPWRTFFVGKGLDIGSGDDPLPFPDCVAFDKAQGDANHLTRYFNPDSFDYIHASQVLEHLYQPEQRLREWLTIVRPGGYLIATVPDIGAYENFTYPSRFNPDHKASFSMIYRGSAFPVHCHIPTLTEALSDVAETILARYIERNYDWRQRHRDQTMEETADVEIWNEIVLRRR